MSMPSNRWAALLPWPPESPRITHRARRRVSHAEVRSLHVDAFDQLAARLLSHARAIDRPTLDALLKSMDAACGELAASGAVTSGQARRLREWLLRDLGQLARMRVHGTAVTRAALSAAGARDVAALRSLLAVLALSDDVLYRAAVELDGSFVRHAGDITSPGLLTCNGCGRSHRTRHSLIIEPCGCGAPTFTKTLG